MGCLCTGKDQIKHREISTFHKRKQEENQLRHEEKIIFYVATVSTVMYLSIAMRVLVGAGDFCPRSGSRRLWLGRCSDLEHRQPGACGCSGDPFANGVGTFLQMIPQYRSRLAPKIAQNAENRRTWWDTIRDRVRKNPPSPYQNEVSCYDGFGYTNQISLAGSAWRHFLSLFGYAEG